MSNKWLAYLLPVLIVLLGYLVWNQFLQPEPPKPPAQNYTQLLQRIDDEKIKRIDLNVESLEATVTEKNKKIPPYTIGIPGQAANEQMVKRSLPPKALFEYKGFLPAPMPWWKRAFINLLPTLLLFGVLIYFMRDMFPGRQPSKLVTSDKTDVSFDEVAGIGEAVQELEDVRTYLHDPKRFHKLGARAPKGVLLYGPPGTGKTLLAKSIAHEADVPFFSVSGSDFVEMFAGLGANRVRAIFKEARQHAPCIIFIDELDAVGRQRGQGGDGGSREADQTLNQILVEMDGFASSDKPVVVMAASNFIKNLDPALLRPGRFDRHIAISAPDRQGRLDILKIHARNKPLAGDVDLEKIAVQTAGMTGADLANLLNEAALQAARDPESNTITRKNMEEAMYRVVAGPAKHNRLMNDKERTMTAYHEMGHAILGEELEANDQVHKISIVPRGESLGQTFYVSEEDVYSRTAGQLRNGICGLMAGRAAEELMMGEYGTGAANDLERATDMAHRMMTQMGFGRSLGFRVSTQQAPISPEKQQEVDEEIQELLDEEYARALEILQQKKDILERCAQGLLQQEVLDRDEFLALLDSQAAFDVLIAERQQEDSSSAA